MAEIAQYSKQQEMLFLSVAEILPSTLNQGQMETLSSEFIILGLHVYHRSNSIFSLCSPPRLWQRMLHLRSGLPRDPMHPETFCCCCLCKLSADFHDLEQDISTSFSAILSLRRQKIQYLLCTGRVLGKLYNCSLSQSLGNISSFVKRKIITFDVAILTSGLWLA